MRIQAGNIQGPKVGLKNNDSVLEALNKQMQKLQEKLKRVETDQKLTSEEKAQQKKQINDQLNALRQQYTQREMAAAMEQKQVKPISGNRSEVNGEDLSALINADGALNRAKSGQSVKTSLENQKRTLIGEIKQDAARGVDVTKKEQKVSALSATIQRILEDMAAGERNILESSEKNNEAAKSMHNETNNNAGHVDMMV